MMKTKLTMAEKLTPDEMRIPPDEFGKYAFQRQGIQQRLPML